MYKIIFDEKAIEFLEKNPSGKRIFDKIMSAKEIPFHFFDRLKARGEYRLRVGDYRVIADINKRKKLINILVIGHRREIYR